MIIYDYDYLLKNEKICFTLFELSISCFCLLLFDLSLANVSSSLELLEDATSAGSDAFFYNTMFH